MSNQSTQQIVRAKNWRFVPHNKARSAYESWNSLKFQLPVIEIPLKMAEEMALQNPIKAFQSEKTFYFFGGFHTVGLVLAQRTEKAVVNIYPSNQTEDIENIARSEFLNPMAYSLHRNAGYASLYTQLNNGFPKHLLEKWFSVRRMTQQKIISFFRVSEASVRGDRSLLFDKKEASE
jgi:hypothetical protein